MTLKLASTVRPDLLMVQQGLARSRRQASLWIRQGRVKWDGVVIDKPTRCLPPHCRLTVLYPEHAADVSRGARKLDTAFLELRRCTSRELAVEGRRCLDAGASTGGFTQVLLSQGARQVIALDVGHGQLSSTLSQDSRVVDFSGTTIRGLCPDKIGGPVDLLVADLSFISLRLVAPSILSMVKVGGDAVLLVKPQFEVGRERLGSNGVVRSLNAREQAVCSVVAQYRESGADIQAVIPSRYPGLTGNVEFFLWCSLPDSQRPSKRLDEKTTNDAIHAAVFGGSL
ncbi:MAG: TlyA family RNA methyltransferase [Actinomycetota bacterium]